MQNEGVEKRENDVNALTKRLINAYLGVPQENAQERDEQLGRVVELAERLAEKRDSDGLSEMLRVVNESELRGLPSNKPYESVYAAITEAQRKVEANRQDDELKSI